MTIENLKNTEDKKVLKFGGTSVATAKQIKKISAIIKSQQNTKVIIVSAPGKRFDDDVKVTDMLIEFSKTLNEELFAQIEQRFIDIAIELELSVDFLNEKLTTIKQNIKNTASKDYVLSRGEYLNGLIIAKYLSADFVDPKDVITINDDMTVTENSYSNISDAINLNNITIFPGFYGADNTGNIKTFSRGGSDISGAIVAKAINSSVYQNWTDVSGMLQADPRIAKNAKTIKEITYSELQELSCFGASVFHEDAVSPCSSANIPINIKNTNAPTDAGTLISSARDVDKTPIVGVSGVQHFKLICIKKGNISENFELLTKIKNLFKEFYTKNIFIMQRIDSLQILVQENDRYSKVINGLKKLGLSGIDEVDDVAHIGIVGEGLYKDLAMFFRILKKLNENNISIYSINYDKSWYSTTVTIELRKYKEAINVIVDELNS